MGHCHRFFVGDGVVERRVVNLGPAPVRYARGREEGDDDAEADIDGMRGADVDASVDEDRRERKGGN
jgi:hypothetical protein